MLPAERELKIMDYLKENKKATILDLANQFDVHSATIRRDLNKLERENRVRRTHGGVIINNEVMSELNFDDRRDENFLEKKKIGMKAAEYVDDGDIIIIDSGSTTLHFANSLFEKKDLTIITNDIHIAAILNSSPNKIIVTGGTLFPNNYVLNGLLTEQSLKTLHPRKLFLATPALDLNNGVTHYNDDFALTKRHMIDQAKEIFLLMDSSKFDKSSLYQVCNIERIDTIITDSSNSNVDLEKYADKVSGVIIV